MAKKAKQHGDAERERIAGEAADWLVKAIDNKMSPPERAAFEAWLEVENNRETFGHSLVVDPWGRIVAEAGVEPGILIAEIDPAEVAAARARIPSLQHGRRFEVVEPMAEPTHLRVVKRQP